MNKNGELIHYGVKGMHWGQRRAANLARAALPRAKNYNIDDHAADKFKFGKKGVDRINENIHKGMDRATARKAEQRLRSNRLKIGIGAYLAARALYVYGPALLQAGAQSYVGGKNEAAGKKAAADLFSDSKGIGNHKIVDLGYDSKTNVWS